MCKIFRSFLTSLVLKDKKTVSHILQLKITEVLEGLFKQRAKVTCKVYLLTINMINNK
jgi:hypothetical protein